MCSLRNYHFVNVYRFGCFTNRIKTFLCWFVVVNYCRTCVIPLVAMWVGRKCAMFVCRHARYLSFESFMKFRFDAFRIILLHDKAKGFTININREQIWRMASRHSISASLKEASLTLVFEHGGLSKSIAVLIMSLCGGSRISWYIFAFLFVSRNYWPMLL